MKSRPFFVTPKRFVEHSIFHSFDAKELKAKLGNRSDHLPVTNYDANTLSWNMLKKCSSKIDKTTGKIAANNGFNISEDEKTYQARFTDNLNYICDTVKAQNISRTLPISVLCFQEVSDIAHGGLSRTQIQALVEAKGFTTIYKQAESKKDYPGYLTQLYSKNSALLIMAYDPKEVEFRGFSPLPPNVISKEQLDDNRYQIAVFLDIKSQQEFVVINTHQNWNLVNPDPTAPNQEPIGNYDLYNLLKYFKNYPCIITGDFNATFFPLTKEAGKIVKGLNANLAIVDGEEKIDSCDHIIMNQKYRKQFLPKKLTAQKVNAFIATASNATPFFAASAACTALTSANSASTTAFKKK